MPLVLWTRWEAPPEIPLGLGALLLAYLLGLGPLRPQEARYARVDPGQVVAFVGAVATLFVTLTGPLADLAGRFLFTAHMLQHLVLTLAVPPLLLAGTPGWLLRPLLFAWSPVAAAARFFTRPLIGLATFSVVLAAWHLPALYSLALASEAVHIVMHLSFLASAVLGWWPLASPLPELPRLAPPLQLLYVLAFGAPMVLVAALVTLADEVLYPHYAAAPRLWGISPLQDQRAGGLLMWIPAHMVLVVPFTVAFFRWARAEADDPEAPSATAAEEESTAPTDRP